MWNILVTESEASVVPWNINGTLGAKVMTNSECVIPLTFLSFSQCVVEDVVQLLFRVGGWATEQLAFRKPQYSYNYSYTRDTSNQKQKLCGTVERLRYLKR